MTAAYALGLADDALVYSHRMAEWVTRAPQLEEDVALANIGLDLLGQARSLLTYVGLSEEAPAQTSRDEDALAYLRDERDFTNVQLVELPNGDFAFSIARMLVFASYQVELHRRLADSTDETLSAVAAKAVKEADYHRDHATQWTLRLGDGTDVSHDKMQAGLHAVWPYVEELFDRPNHLAPLIESGVAVDPASLREPTLARVGDVIAEATLAVPQTHVRHHGGRVGIHTEHLGYVLAEMQHLARSHPGATW